MVKRHTDVAQDGAAQPGTVQAVRAGIQIFRVLDDQLEAFSHCSDAFFCDQRHHGVTVLGVQPFRGMCDGVHAAGYRQFDRKGRRQLRVIDDGLRQNAHVFARPFDAVFSQAINRGHFGAGVGGRDCKNWQAGFQGNRFTQAGGRAAADGHSAVSPQCLSNLTSLTSRFDWDVHDGFVEDAGSARTQDVGDAFCLATLFWSREYQCSARSQVIDFSFELLK
ncbi:hypothetical protein D3C80_1314430 [compost metagenome]